MAPNVYITGNPARDSATSRNLEQAMSNMNVTNPLSGVQSRCSSRWPTRWRKSSYTWSRPIRHGHRRSRRLRRATISSAPRRTTPCANNDLSNCVFLPNTAPPNQTFAWNHGGIQTGDQIDMAGSGRSGSRQEREAQQRLLLRSHRCPPDDARADRPEGLLRVRRPRADGAREELGVTTVAEDAARGCRSSGRRTSRSTRRSASSRWTRSSRPPGRSRAAARATRPTPTSRTSWRLSVPIVTRSRRRSGPDSGTGRVQRSADRASSRRRPGSTRPTRSWLRRRPSQHRP